MSSGTLHHAKRYYSITMLVSPVSSLMHATKDFMQCTQCTQHYDTHTHTHRKYLTVVCKYELLLWKRCRPSNAL